MPARHHPVGFMGWLARAPALPVTLTCRADHFFMFILLFGFPVGVVGPVGPGGGMTCPPFDVKPDPPRASGGGQRPQSVRVSTDTT